MTHFFRRLSLVLILAVANLICFWHVNAVHGQYKPAGATVVFDAAPTPWARVLENLVDHTGLPYLSTIPAPHGTFTAPPGKQGKLPLREAVDLINRALAPEQFVLMRRADSWTLVDTTNRVPISLLPILTDPESLEMLADSEPALLFLRLRHAKAPAVAAEVRKRLGPLGQATPLEDLAGLLMVDSAANLKRLSGIVRAADVPEKERKPLSPIAEEEVPKLAQRDPALTVAEVDRRDHLRLELVDQRERQGFLRYSLDNSYRRVRPAAGWDQPRVVDAADKTVVLDAKVLAVERRGIVIATGGKTYAWHIDQSLTQALERPMTDAEVAALEKRLKETAPMKKGQMPERRTQIEMRRYPWAKALEWLTDATGLAVRAEQPGPTGSFNCILPRDKDYPVLEAIAFCNEALVDMRWALVRADARELRLIPADEVVDPKLVPRLPPAALPTRASAEIVSIALPLTKLKAAEVAGDVRKLLTPFGQVQAMEQANSLLIQDLAVRLRSLAPLLAKLDQDGPR
jgi:hypothetical protein